MEQEANDWRISKMSQTIFRKRYSSNYTAIPNKYTRDSGLSWKAKGILTHLLTLPQDWEVNASYLSDQSTDGLDSVYSGLNELIAAKYLWRRTRAGRAPGGYEVFVYDEPNLEDPFVESSGSGNSRSGKAPVRENPAQLKKEEEQSKEKEQSTEQAFSDLRSAVNSDKEVNADAIDSRPPNTLKPASSADSPKSPPIELPPELDCPDMRSAWNDFVAYRKERKKPVTPTTAKILFNRMKAWGADTSADALRDSIANGWQGVFPSKEANRPNVI
jgi:hypothetical protein